MASSPETAPSQKYDSSNSSSSDSNSTKSDSGSSSPPPSSPSPPSSDQSSSPPPASPPPQSPPPSSPPPPKSSPPPSSPPPSSPPPSSPPPSSPPPSSPPPSSPPPSSPPPDKDSPSPPPPESSKSSPPASPPPLKSASSPPDSETPPPPASASSPPSPSTSDSSPTPPAVFSPPPPVTDAALSPPAAPTLLPPPRTPSLSSPSTSRSSDGSANSSSSTSDTSHVAIIAGVAVAGVIILAFMVVCLLCTLRKKRKHYYMDPMSRPPTGGHAEYYHGSQQWNSPADHVVKLPPPPGIMVPPPAGWGPQSQPPANASTEYSSSFSGLQQQAQQPISPNVNLGFSKSQFSYEELATATDGFSQVNLLGQGGFGYVHKGVLPNGEEIAVKSLKSGSGQGEREFRAEVEIISRVHHRHLVSLVGYCLTNEQRMLVFEFVPNKTLEYHLHGKGRPVMDWAARLRIAVGSAKGLAYLHEDCHPKIIHRDIKAANILLDKNYEAMVADFGLAKLSSDNFTHVSTRVMGTFGYLAPEYASSGKLTEKSDVFSFGVMLLELITGRRPVDPTSNIMEDSLVDWARPKLTKAMEDGNYDELVDPRLEGNFVPQEMARMVAAASASIRHSARRRPKMSQIIRTLEGDHSSLDDLDNEGPKGSQSSAIGLTQAYDTNAYNADMMKFRKMVMNSEELPSSEFGTTSEYGLNPSSSSSEAEMNMNHSGNQNHKP